MSKQSYKIVDVQTKKTKIVTHLEIYEDDEKVYETNLANPLDTSEEVILAEAKGVAEVYFSDKLIGEKSAAQEEAHKAAEEVKANIVGKGGEIK